ncbi:UNVERIFIED_CONTAM: hypothetical protein NCL1_42144 [Trichonephila clavipes]
MSRSRGERQRHFLLTSVKYLFNSLKHNHFIDSTQSCLPLFSLSASSESFNKSRSFSIPNISSQSPYRYLIQIFNR